MPPLLYLYTFVLGLLLGSFYNVVGLRIPLGKSIVHPPSHCPHCQRKLSLLDLIPVLSYLSIRGRCRSCNKKISSIYPKFEFLTAVLFTFALWQTGWSRELIVSWTLISLLIIIVVSDLHYMLIPNKVLLFFVSIVVPMRIFIPMDPWWEPVAGFILGFSLLFLIALVTKGGMGGGDVKLFAVLGLFLGWQGVLICFFFSCLYGALIGGLALWLGKVKRREPIPFGPFIALGSITAYFLGDPIVYWYVYQTM